MQVTAEPLSAQTLTAFAPLVGRLVAAVLIAVVFWRVAGATRGWFDRAVARSSADVHLRVLVGRLLYSVVLVYGLIWGIEVLGISPAALLAGFGVLGIAASLALQDILKSVCAGVYLLFERPFLIGDEIRVRDYQGRVADVGIRTTALHLDDGREVLIPNSVLLADVILNRTARRVTGGGAPPPPGA